jgi:hypothetical protein
MEFVGKKRPISSGGLSEALLQIGLQANEAAVIWSVIDVETSGITQGCGFRADGRPQILFERHIFRRETGGRFDKIAPHLSGPQGGYGGLATQYGKLEEAVRLCENAGLSPEPALRATSWGLGQVMGFNASVAGFVSATEMVKAMQDSEDGQIMAMARFMRSQKLHKD